MNSDNLNFYLTHWDAANKEPFFDYVRKASKAELNDLHRRIKAHAKEHENRRLHRAINPGLRSSHSLALAAVNWELKKRSKIIMWFHNTTFPIRKWWSGFWSGKDLQQSDYVGLLVIERETGNTLFYFYGLRRWVLKIIILPVLQYLGRNVSWIVPAIVAALVAIYVANEFGN